jgi:hypothetical protein
MADEKAEKTLEELILEYEAKARGATKVVVELGIPFTSSGAPKTSITLRRPTVGDARRAAKHAPDDEGRSVYLAALLSGESPEDIEKIDIADFEIVQAVIIGFRAQRVAR